MHEKYNRTTLTDVIERDIYTKFQSGMVLGGEDIHKAFPIHFESNPCAVGGVVRGLVHRKVLIPTGGHCNMSRHEAKGRISPLYQLA